MKDKMGSGWDRETDGKKRISVALDLGMLGNVSCAVFENTRRDPARNQPTDNLVFTPEGGKTKYVGAFWKKKAKKSGADYWIGRLTLKEIGILAVGGVTVDFSKAEAPIDAKICRSTGTDPKGPQYHVFRVKPIAKGSQVGEEE